MLKISILPLLVISSLTTLTGCNKEPIPEFECSFKQYGSGVTDTKIFKKGMISEYGEYFFYKPDDKGYKFKLEVYRRILSATMIMTENKTTNIIFYLTGVCK